MTAPTAAELADVALFAELSDTDRATLAEWLEVEEIDSGQRLTHQGAAGYAFFILRAGAASVSVDGYVVRTLGPGDYFGEIAMLADGRQTATVQVTAPSVVWRMFGTRFRELQAHHPTLAAELLRSATERLASG